MKTAVMLVLEGQVMFFFLKKTINRQIKQIDLSVRKSKVFPLFGDPNMKRRNLLTRN